MGDGYMEIKEILVSPKNLSRITNAFAASLIES